MTVREEKIAQMKTLAVECGFVCEPVTKYRHEFARAITARLAHRRGKDVYQSAAFSIPLFSMQAGVDLFGLANLTKNTDRCLAWHIDQLSELAAFMGSMLGETG